MNKFIKKNQKKILAIFSAGLMISFGLGSYIKGDSQADAVVGNAGRTKITRKDLTVFNSDWEVLKKMMFAYQAEPDPRKPDSAGMTIPAHLLPYQLGEGFTRGMGNSTERLTRTLEIGSQVVKQMEDNPELFYLLVREAESMGTVVSNDDVQRILKNSQHPDDPSGIMDDRAAEAVRNLLLVCNAADRAAEAFKVSRPYRDQALANKQMMSLNLVEFKAADYLEKVPEWTGADKTAKLNAQYEQYKNYPPTTRPVNDFPFGYQIPNRVQVQYIEIPGAAVRKAVATEMATQKRQIQVEANTYYLQHRKEFPKPIGQRPRAGVAATSQPADLPVVSKVFTQFEPTHRGSALVNPLIPATQPEADYSDEYRDEIVERLTDERINRRTADIVGYVYSMMVSDYAVFKSAFPAGAGNPTTGPSIPPEMLTKVPPSSLGARYDGYEYLQKLADSVETKFGVRPITQKDLSARTAKELEEEPDISKAAVDRTDLMTLFNLTRGENIQLAFHLSELGKFPAYATRFVAALADGESSQASRQYPGLRILSLYEPSPQLHTQPAAKEPANFFYFRAVLAEPAHPADLKDVEAKVLADARLVAAQKLAADAATKFANNALTLNTHIESIAPAAGKTVITTGLFSTRRAEVPKYDLPAGAAQAAFIQEAFKFVHSAVPHPIAAIDFHPTLTALAAEVNQIEPMWTPTDFPVSQLETTAEIERGHASELRSHWFNADDIYARSHYVPASGKRRR